MDIKVQEKLFKYATHLQHIYGTFTAHLQHIYSTFTAHLQHIYSTFTAHLQHIYSTLQHMYCNVLLSTVDVPLQHICCCSTSTVIILLQMRCCSTCAMEINVLLQNMFWYIQGVPKKMHVLSGFEFLTLGWVFLGVVFHGKESLFYKIFCVSKQNFEKMALIYWKIANIITSS